MDEAGAAEAVLAGTRDLASVFTCKFEGCRFVMELRDPPGVPDGAGELEGTGVAAPDLGAGDADGPGAGEGAGDTAGLEPVVAPAVVAGDTETGGCDVDLSIAGDAAGRVLAVAGRAPLVAAGVRLAAGEAPGVVGRAPAVAGCGVFKSAGLEAGGGVTGCTGFFVGANENSAGMTGPVAMAG